ncbi:methyltransferase domain-containing protein [Parashewanella spongiae]|uniref:Arsenite methyltransferase n=1 Tax=Parashewanella spongiae TaxID=342950 RepID=A0A3A6TQ09_9GAMM|nr:methyltransferase domain-containing protein [Parashewanella spongiae]MCL1077742.1 methyltransferase domain-containing protein [Parashewanella spongiae]RJY18057.1 methyltransferase domain-containing protein [Parashewanella spongiae]
MSNSTNCCSPSQAKSNTDTHDAVKDYYGKVLAGSDDLQTNACCTDDDLTPELKLILSNIHDDVLIRYYGCGLVTPELLEGCHVLDLGCGAGRDCYAIAQMVGERGSVTGVDMTDEQLDIANKHIDYHRMKFGFDCANTTFLKGYIEKLNELDIADNSFDVVVSNCVINLSPDKNAVLKEIFRILKPGGEIYFSDVYADKRVPNHLRQDPLLYGECLSGALYWNDFENLAKSVGFTEPRLVNSRVITVDNEQLANRLEDIKFTSATYRLFKAVHLETDAQDYGQSVKYLGSIPHSKESFNFDQSTTFYQNKLVNVSGNTFHTLQQSRFSEHFEFNGSFEKHLGLFKAQIKALDFSSHKDSLNDSSCCTPSPVVKKSCC